MRASTTKLATAVAALVAATAVLAGCSLGGDDESARLQALRDDPMGEYEPGSGELVDTDEQEEGETTLGKPQLASRTRLFALPAGQGARALADALAAASDAGWSVDAAPVPGVGGSVALGEKRLETGRARLALALLTDERVLRDGVSPPALRITLEHMSS